MIKMLVCDFDGTVSGDGSDVRAFNDFVVANPQMEFVIATGRTFGSLSKALSDGGYVEPRAIISDVGTQLRHGASTDQDRHWQEVVSRQWDRSKLCDHLAEYSFLGEQSHEHQGDYKVTIQGKLAPKHVAMLESGLHERGHQVEVTYSHEWFLDITPKGIDKASAIAFLAEQKGLSRHEVVVAGDSANDLSMLTLSGVKGIMVANHYPEIAHLAAEPQMYAASKPFAQGVIEGTQHWQQQSVAI